MKDKNHISHFDDDNRVFITFGVCDKKNRSRHTFKNEVWNDHNMIKKHVIKISASDNQ